MGFRYSYDQLVYYGEDVEDSIDRLARFGYDAIELAGEPDAFDAAAVRRRAEQAGIAVGSICSIYTAERDLSHPDGAIREQAAAYVRQVAEFAAAVGAPTMIIAPAAVGRLAPLAAREDEWKWAVEGVRAGGEYAAGLGVNLTLECWNRYETYFLNRLEQAVELWNETGLSNGGVMGDTFHMNIEEDSIADAIRRTGPLLNHVHLADSNRSAPGQGHTDFGEILTALKEIDYQGYVTFELLPPSADPFGVMRAGGHHDFFDRFTEQAIVRVKELERGLAGVA
ncbi:MAG: Sugar phosphate isomerase/epimerase [Conexibacter sp.]|nr:Sugar phosphate isomerase/epimerase [Conexibacter sp.]